MTKEITQIKAMSFLTKDMLPTQMGKSIERFISGLKLQFDIDTWQNILDQFYHHVTLHNPHQTDLSGQYYDYILNELYTYYLNSLPDDLLSKAEFIELLTTNGVGGLQILRRIARREGGLSIPIDTSPNIFDMSKSTRSPYVAYYYDENILKAANEMIINIALPRPFSLLMILKPGYNISTEQLIYSITDANGSFINIYQKNNPVPSIIIDIFDGVSTILHAIELHESIKVIAIETGHDSLIVRWDNNNNIVSSTFPSSASMLSIGTIELDTEITTSILNKLYVINGGLSMEQIVDYTNSYSQ